MCVIIYLYFNMSIGDFNYFLNCYTGIGLSGGLTMPHFSKSSLKQLATCHDDLQILFNTVIKYYDCTVLEGFRNQVAQDKAFADGLSKLKFPHGKHNRCPSVAVDVIPYPIDWNDTHRHLLFGGYVLGVAQMLKDAGKISHSVRWGGSWNGLDKLNTRGMLNDMVHFELVGV